MYKTQGSAAYRLGDRGTTGASLTDVEKERKAKTVYAIFVSGV